MDITTLTKINHGFHSKTVSFSFVWFLKAWDHKIRQLELQLKCGNITIYLFTFILLKFYSNPYGRCFFNFHNIWGRGHNNKILLRASIYPAAALVKTSPQSVFEEILLYQLQFWQPCINILYNNIHSHQLEDILKKVENQTVAGPRWLWQYREHCGPATVWLSTFFKIAFMFNRRRKLRFKTTFE